MRLIKSGDKQWYKKGLRVLMLIHRKKDGGPAGCDREAIRRLSRDEGEFDKVYAELKEIKDASQSQYRIYCSVNARDVMRAIRMFKIEQVELEGQSIHHQIYFYTNADRKFLSCLCKYNCCVTKWFLIDLDTKDVLDVARAVTCLEEVTTILDMRETLNGWHVITEPYNPALTPKLEVKKDSMVLLEW